MNTLTKVIQFYKEKIENLEYHLKEKRDMMFTDTIERYQSELRCYKRFLNDLNILKNEQH